MSSHNAPPILSSQSFSFSPAPFIPFILYFSSHHQWAPFLYTLDSRTSSAKILPHSYCRFSAFSCIFDFILWHVVPQFLNNPPWHLLLYTLGSSKCLLVNILICLHWIQLSICLPFVYSQSLVIPSQIFPSQVLANLLFFVICVIILIGKPKCLFYTILMYLKSVINSF